MESNYLFTVIIPCYNTERYIEECIDSVIGQTIGFAQTTQVILIDDGSSDGTLDICKRYAAQHPDNIVLLEQSHGGASAARNLGMQHAQGEYVCFLDSDDKWDVGAFAAIHGYFKDNPLINLAAARIIYFGAWDTPHALDFKFEATGTVNIFANANNPQLSGTTTIYRRRILDGASFPAVSVSEDFAFVGRLILECGAFGVIREAVYYYRKREDDSSTIDNSYKQASFYTDILTQVYQKLFDYSRELYGYVIPYIQYSVMYDLKWRIIAKDVGFLDADRMAEYKTALASLLSSISDGVICRQTKMSPYQKVYTLALKRGKTFDGMRSSLKLRWLSEKKKLEVVTPRKAVVCTPTLTIEILEIRKGKLHIEGCLNAPLSPEKIVIEARSKKAVEQAVLIERKDREETVFFEKAFCRRTGFSVDIKPGERAIISFALMANGVKRKIDFGFGSLCKLTGGNVSAYIRQGGYYIISRKASRLEVVKNSSRSYGLKRELSFSRGILKKEGSSALSTVFLRWRTLRARRGAHAKNIWILSDRIEEGGDNGEAMFAFVAGRKDVDAYFAIDKASRDYGRLGAVGNVVDFGSKEYRRLFLQSSCILSSSFDAHVYRLVGPMEEYLKSLYDFKFVFLQHGVTKDDFSRSLGRYKKGIDLFVTSSPREAESIVQNEYYYDEDQVALTGMPRLDLLEEAGPPEKVVVVAPTWRDNLVKGFSKVDDSAIIDEADFQTSEYFRRYSSILSDERLLAVLREHGYRLDFVLHPGFRKLAHLFAENDVVRIPTEYNYRQGFIEAALWITDYSSVAFDFAFLKKPLAYYQYDEDEVFGGGHIYGKGYFDYRRDGFGPVIADEAEIIDFMVEQIAQTPKMPDEYAARVDAFFYQPKERGSRRQLLFDRITDLLGRNS